MTKPHNIPVAIGLIIKDSCALLGKRTSGHYSGYWEFPGGKIESGETSEQALVREMREELSIDVVKATEVIHIRDDHQITLFHLQIWHIDEYKGPIIANEQQHLQWARIDSLEKLNIIPTNVPILHYLKQLEANRQS